MDSSTSTDPVSKEVISCKKQFEEMLDKMKLTTTKPLSLLDAITIKQQALSTMKYTNCYEILPHLVLHKLLMSDSSCRTCLFKMNTAKYENDDSESDSENNSNNDSEETNGSEEDADEGIHPMDCLLGIIHCCDDFLRQDLIHKLSLCQLAIPFLVPNPVDCTLNIYLWGMRSIVKNWKSKRHGEMEYRIVDYEGPIISAMRIGEIQISKSKMLNELISDQKHDIFFNWDCNEFGFKRKFVNGVVELCCYLPTGKESSADFYPEAITFLNLRGDATDHPKQVNFLKNINILSVVFISEDSFNDKNIETLQSLAESPRGIIILVCKGNSQSAKDIYTAGIEKLRHSIPEHQVSRIKLFGKPLLKMKKEMQKKIGEKLNNSKTDGYEIISKSMKLAHSCGIKVDEDVSFSKIGFKNAKMILDIIENKKTETENLGKTNKHATVTDIKQTMFPLQGPKLWHEWAKINKEQHRHIHIKKSCMDITHYNAKLQQEKQNIRKTQVDCSITNAVDYFLNGVTDKCSRKYFLQWLKMLLDDYSRKILPNIHNEYQAIKNELLQSSNKSSSSKEDQQLLENKLIKKNQQIINSSFGIEHFLREMGQIYEARMDLPLHNDLKNKVANFPQIMAELMVDGYPLELMDGEASHVPLTWVKAIIEKLKDTYYKASSKKLFVLSVLGIQGSGKSTLLNTIFGLCFNVSAGRCTRGAFCQIVPLDNTLDINGFSHIMVIDTEGLRAPELQLQGLKHDNELATFVIGLADATIINISGEVQGDLNDVLQTSVHAFIRMRAINMNPSCHFVHQNVQDILAKSKNTYGRQKFQETLDKMTRAAAEFEGCGDLYKSFCDVIHFDDSMAVFYFPNLWQGEPPMSPISIPYSNSAHELKISLIQFINDHPNCGCTFEVFKLRLDKLWNGVLGENFVFNFKNTLAVSAFHEMDSQYTDWSWTLQYRMLQWEKKAKKEISNYSCTENIDKLCNKCIADAQTELDNTYSELCDKMKSFISTSDHADTLSEHEFDIQTRLKSLKNEYKIKASEFCRNLLKNKLNYLEGENQRENCVLQLQDEIKNLVLMLWKKENQLSDKDLENEFNSKWEKEWVESKKINYLEEHQIDKEICDVLKELLVPQQTKITKKLSASSLQQRKPSLTMDLNTEFHLALKYPKFLSTPLNRVAKYPTVLKWIPFTKREFTESEIEVAKGDCNDLIREACTAFNLEDFQSLGLPKAQIWKTLKNLFDMIDVKNSRPECTFTFTKHFTVDCGISVCTILFHIIKTNIENLKNKDPFYYLETLKSTFLDDFKSQYKDVSKEETAAGSLCNLLMNPITADLQEHLESEIVQDIKKYHKYSHSKRHFKVQILTDLAKQNDFSLYQTYLRDINSSLLSWAKFYVEQHCQKETEGKTRIIILSETRLMFVIQSIKDAANGLCKQASNIKRWIENFHVKISTVIASNKAAMLGIIGVQEVNNLHYFETFVIEGLEHVEIQIQQEICNPSSIFGDVTSWIKSPHLELCKNLVGCTKVCPFCKEQCELGSSNHPGNHSIFLHRPECLGSYVWTKDKQLVLNLCTELINTNTTFRNKDTSNKAIPCREYHKYYPDWDIPADTNADPIYWKWFVFKYQNEIQNWIKSSDTHIPSSWNVSVEVAIENLKDTYKIN